MKNNIAIVLGNFHKKEMDIMLEIARDTAKEKNLNIVKEIWVPGSLEKPLMVKKLLQDSAIDGVVVLGIFDKGGTAHGLVMGQAVTKALIDLQLEYEKPIGMGIMGPEIEPEQISPRIRLHATNAVSAVAEMLKILEE